MDTAFSFSYSLNTKVANIVLLLGGTILNSYETSSILQNVRRSLSPNDILIFNGNIDDTINNLNFSYVHSPEALVQDTWIPRAMGIDVDKCEFITEFEVTKNQKIEYIILDKDYTINFEYGDFNRSVSLSKKDKITLWTYSITDLENCIELFKNAGFSLLDAITLPDKKHFMIAVQSNG